MRDYFDAPPTILESIELFYKQSKLDSNFTFYTYKAYGLIEAYYQNIIDVSGITYSEFCESIKDGMTRYI